MAVNLLVNLLPPLSAGILSHVTLETEMIYEEKNIRPISSIYILLSFLVTMVLAESAWGIENGNIAIHGFLLGNFTGRTTGLKSGGGKMDDFLLAEERFRLDISTWSNSIEASAKIKVDFFQNALDEKSDLDLREAYIDYTKGDFDFRIGRQIATWGVGDLLFINDIFPKDWMSFFSGRPLEYLKVGVDGFQTRYSSRALNADLMIIPFFEPDILPNPERFFLFNPFNALSSQNEEIPEHTYGNTELALRLYRKIGDFDISGYAYKGFWKTPGMRPDSFTAPTQVTAFYPELSVYGFSAQKSALGGVLSLENGCYRSRDDIDGDDPTITNSQIRLLFGYGRQLKKDLTLGIQYYVEVMEDYSTYKNTLPAGFPEQKEYRDIFTLRLEQLLKHQTVRISLFTFYGAADNDYLIQPRISYKFSDNLSTNLGANVFGGEKDSTFLGQFDKNDNIYLSVSFDF